MQPLKPTKATVVRSRTGRDTIHLQFEGLPSPFPKIGYPLSAVIETEGEYGETYCREVLGIEPEVISYVRY